jgi:ubiquitin-conjugating enzyme E2 Q
MEWVQTRYLIVQTATTSANDAKKEVPTNLTVKPMDPRYPVVLSRKPISIPDDIAKFTGMEIDCDDDPFSMSDQDILKAVSASQVMEISDDDDEEMEMARKKKAQALEKQRENYVPFAPKVLKNLRTLPPPRSAAGSATMYLSREVKAIMATQAKSSPQELGFYFDPSTTNDNLFHWIVEMLSFDSDLPIARDMADKGVSVSPSRLSRIPFNSFAF